MFLEGRIANYDGDRLTVIAHVPAADAWVLNKQRIRSALVTLQDGRKISLQQRKLIYALLGEMADWFGNDPDYEKKLRKYHFTAQTGCGAFSLSSVDMTTANRFVDYLLDACLEHGVGLSFRPIEQLTGKQIGRWVYRCLVHRTCCVCGRRSQTHHVDAIGMGRNRDEICHIGMRAMPLCGEHHAEAHTLGQKRFDAKYHVSGVKLDAYLVRELRLGRQAAQ